MLIRLNIKLSIVLFTSLLSACNDPAQNKQPTVKPFEAQTQALEEAKQLEQSMQTAAETQRKNIDAQVQ